MNKMASVFPVLGIAASIFLVSYALLGAFQPASAARDWSKCYERNKDCSKQQARAFDRCIEEASKDGELTDAEYFACAYSIYG
jgi:hypothetical protein